MHVKRTVSDVTNVELQGKRVLDAEILSKFRNISFVL